MKSMNAHNSRTALAIRGIQLGIASPQNSLNGVYFLP